MGENPVKSDTMTCRNPGGCNHRAVTFTSRCDAPNELISVCQMCYSMYSFLNQANRFQKGFDDADAKAAGLTFKALHKCLESAGTKWTSPKDVEEIYQMIRAHPSPRDFFITMGTEAGTDFCGVPDEYQCGEEGGCGYHVRLWHVMLALGDITELPTAVTSPGQGAKGDGGVPLISANDPKQMRTVNCMDVSGNKISLPLKKFTQIVLRSTT